MLVKVAATCKSRFEHTHYSSTLAPHDGWSGALQSALC